MSRMVKRGPSSWTYEPEPEPSSYDGEFGCVEAEDTRPIRGQLSRQPDLLEDACERMTTPPIERMCIVPPDIFEPDHPQLDDGLRFAELYGELRNVRAERDSWEEAYEDLHGQLKVMTEDRDEYRREALAETERFRTLSPVARQFAQIMKGATGDEFKLVHRIVTKLMGEGRKEYGPFCVSTETRTAEHLRDESADELADAIVYGAMAEMVGERE